MNGRHASLVATTMCATSNAVPLLPGSDDAPAAVGITMAARAVRTA